MIKESDSAKFQKRGLSNTFTNMVVFHRMLTCHELWKEDLFYLYVYGCAFLSSCVLYVPGEAKRCAGCPELELQTAVWVLGTHPGSSPAHSRFDDTAGEC